ncbi:hypothetical protein DM480_06260 [Sphingomonas sp. FARSPH]|nr:hypothetical protein DM480_06260 [Sphingomonas sp. FARSPH]
MERGRRLEVIDTHTSARATSHARAAPPSTPRATPLTTPGSPHAWLRKVSFDGTADLTTHRLYDDHGPRTIRLDPGSARIVNGAFAGLIALAVALVVAAVFWPAILLVLAALAQNKVRAGVRRRVTEWLDRVAREAS